MKASQKKGLSRLVVMVVAAGLLLLLPGFFSGTTGESDASRVAMTVDLTGNGAAEAIYGPLAEKQGAGPVTPGVLKVVSDQNRVILDEVSGIAGIAGVFEVGAAFPLLVVTRVDSDGEWHYYGYLYDEQSDSLQPVKWENRDYTGGVDLVRDREGQVVIEQRLEEGNAGHRYFYQRWVYRDGQMVPEIDDRDMVVYQGPVENIFFHPLIAYPELAFDNDSLSRGYDDWFITVKEFNRILESLYRNDFILVDTGSLYEAKTVAGKPVLVRKELRLPPGKKPLIFSIDDLNYYDYMIENGNVHKLVLDENGDVATYSTTPQGEKLISRTNEIIPILDDFVRQHPDFSFRGAKGVIALTGYSGVLGYRTNNPDSPDYETEKKEALAVIKRLKETGWVFASHGYGHLDARKRGRSDIAGDTRRWQEEVASLVGPTQIYIFPYGSSVLPGDPKFQDLLDEGFRMFQSVGPTSYAKYTDAYILMDRRHIDGIALRQQQARLADLFDCDAVLDDVRPH